LMGRTALDEEDLKAAVRLVLLPRATLQGAAAANDSAVRDSGEPEQACPGTVEDLVLEAVDCAAPQDIPRSPKRWAWNRGRSVRAVPARRGATKIAIAATLAAAAPHQKLRRSTADGPAIKIAAGDLRFKQFRQSAPMRIVFAVDASGSMAMNRIEHAKGAVIRLLKRAYRDRDEIALIGFRGDEAEVLLGPGRSVERAKRALDALPVGGGTPLAAGLEAASRVCRRVRPSDPRETLLVILTDGRANVPRRPDAVLWEDIEEACRDLRREAVVSVVIDTTRREVSGGEAGRLARLLGARLVHLPNPGPDAVYEAVAAEAAAVRRSGKHA